MKVKKDGQKQPNLRTLPSVHHLLHHPDVTELIARYSRKLVAEAVREAIEQRREAMRAGLTDGSPLDEHRFIEKIKHLLAEKSRSSLRPVVNATGVIIHTNLGRSLLPQEAIKAVEEMAISYSTLEYDLEAGKRGSRYVHTERLLQEITGGEAALVVNNNAGAVLLVLSTLAKGKEVVISRGELVEIGGSFRIPDVMMLSGAILREVGCTNRTSLDDYEHAISPETVALMKVHKSNYRITGFSADVAARELAACAHRRDLLALEDMGSGCFVDLSPFGFPDEPTVQGELKAGMDVVTFSGDKLLGGPQAGIILGRREIIERLKKNPLTRALRVDKLTLAALDATLRLYYDGHTALERIPTLRMITTPARELEAHARALASRIASVRTPEPLEITVVSSIARAGGGALPEQPIPSYAVSIGGPGSLVQSLEWFFRSWDPPIITRIEHDHLLVDVRTLQRGDEAHLIAAWQAFHAHVPESPLPDSTKDNP